MSDRRIFTQYLTEPKYRVTSGNIHLCCLLTLLNCGCVTYSSVGWYGSFRLHHISCYKMDPLSPYGVAPPPKPSGLGLYT